MTSTKAPGVNVIYADGDFTEISSLTELPLRELPELPELPGSDSGRLFGRDEITGLVFDQIISGRSVQLHGEPGVGKKAIALAVQQRLASRGTRGHFLLPRPGEEYCTLDLVYQRLAGLFLGRHFLRNVDEKELRSALSGASAHITLIDCPLSREDISRLLATFSGCTFLITSRSLTLTDLGGAHQVEPLTRTDAIDLISTELGLALGEADLEKLHFDQAYRLAEGKPQRLQLYAEFIKSSNQWRARSADDLFDQPVLIDPDLMGPREQAQVLAAFTREAGRRVLVALKSLEVPLTPAWLSAVTGDPQAPEVLRELYDRRLVTRDGDRYQITDDAAAAVDTYGWPSIGARTAAEGILALANTPRGAALDPGMLLAIASELDANREWATASCFGRTAMPIALAAGRGRVAMHLCALGKKAAGLASAAQDLGYYVRAEQRARQFLPADDIAAVPVGTSGPGGQSEYKAIRELDGIADRIRSTRWGGRLPRGKALMATATATIVIVAAAIGGAAMAATGASGQNSMNLAPCQNLTQLTLDLGNIQAGWINGDDVGHKGTPIPALLAQAKSLDLSVASSTTNPQVKKALAALLSGIQAFGSAYDAGADYGNSLGTFSGAAASAADDAISKDMNNPSLNSVCTGNG